MSSFRCGSCAPAPPSLPLSASSLVVGTMAASVPVGGENSAPQRQSDSPAFFSPAAARPAEEKVLSDKIDKLSHMMASFTKSQKATNDSLFHELKSLSRSNEQIISSNKQLVTQVTELGDKFKALSISNTELTNRCDGLESENACLRGLLTGAISRLEHLEHVSCAEDVVISGLPEAPGEDLPSLVQSIGTTLNTVLVPGTILAAHRLGSAAPDASRPRSVLVRLASDVLRNKLIEQKRRKGTLFARDIPGLGYAAGSGRLYINEGLPPTTRRLLAESRRSVAQHGWQQAWVRNGAVYIINDVNTRPIRVKHLQDIGLIGNERPDA